MSSKYSFLIVAICFFIVGSPLLSSTTIAADIEVLKQKIGEKAQSINQLEEEINKYEAEISVVQSEASTLQNAIKTLDLTRKKLATDINLTETKIGGTNLKLNQTEIEIANIERKIALHKDTISLSIRSINERDQYTLVEAVLGNDDIASFLNEREVEFRIQESLKDAIGILGYDKETLLGLKHKTLTQKEELALLQKEIIAKKTVVDENKKEKDGLLKETKNKESTYKQILDEKIALRDAFQAELSRFESELQIEIDPSKVANAGKNVLAWPIADAYITQKFGNTAFSQSQAGGVYNGNGHNGIDLRASVGTQIMSAASGVVEGTGDTDLVCKNASYGKWVFVKHDNGLSTLYAHLSVISVKAGDSVLRGQTLGYSGNTGYSTGPHLHFTVYASQGVKILERKSQVCGGTYVMPIADLKAYLDPLEYL